MNRFRAVLFDLDGTLIDSLTDLAGAANAVLERYTFPVHPLEAYRYFIGEGFETLVRRVLPPDKRQPQLVDECVAAMRAEYRRLCMATTRPYPGIAELLTYLSERKVPMAVLSNKPDDLTQKIVARLLSPWSFFAVQGARADLPKKPHPEAAVRIAAAAGIAPASFFYAGDTSTDMQTASRAGMFAAGVTWGLRPAAELLDSGARVLINHPQEIGAYFRRPLSGRCC